MNKLVMVGTLPEIGNVFVEIEYKDGRLSISGVEGPRRNGDCHGSAGQITLDPEKIEPNVAEGWSKGCIEILAQFWQRWHLNDMRAGCEHQRVSWNTTEQVEVVEYSLTSEAMKEMQEVKEDIIKRIIEHGRYEASDNLRAFLKLPMFIKGRAPDANGPESGQYKVYKREIKTVNWVYPNEHPKGIMSKPCEVCGYKYGTKWLREEVPADVIAWLQALPETNYTYPWRRR